jgi:hypothetical protein
VAEPRFQDAAHARAVHRVEAAPPLSPDLHQSRLLEHVEVARRGRPAVPEARGQVSGRQLAAEMAEDEEDVPAHLVSERGEHDVSLGQGHLHGTGPSISTQDKY